MLPRIRKSLNSLSIAASSPRFPSAQSLPHRVPTTIADVLGEVLTAVVTPFRDERLDRPRRLPRAVRSPPRQRLRRDRRHRHDRRGADALRRRADDALRGRGRDGGRARDGRRGHRHVRDGPLGAPHRAGARARRRRLPRRDAVLQQAAAARDRRARRDGRGCHRPAGDLLRHPEPRRRRRRAGDDLAPRRDPERPRRQAGEAEPRRSAARRLERARPVCRGRRPGASVPRGRRRRRRLRPHARRRACGSRR